jgi:hypothetical protein
VRVLRRPGPWVFAILLGSYAFFWHARDWNVASRLMLTYALVDRGTIRIDGLQQQTGDLAYFRGHYYSDKLPGYSLLAAGPYAAAKAALRLPDHPLNLPGFAYWPADYWVTLATSGVVTACAAVVLVVLARDLGCGPRRAALVGLSYGLATPAYVYATLAYGHQTSAFALLASFALLWRQSLPAAGRTTSNPPPQPSPTRGEGDRARPSLAKGEVGDRHSPPEEGAEIKPSPLVGEGWVGGVRTGAGATSGGLRRRRQETLRMVAAGFLASYAAVIELQVGPVSAILGLYLLAQVVGGRRRPMALGEFAVGAAVPSLVLLGYNQLAFGSPWDMGYFHHATAMFRDVHSAKNPLGLRHPDLSRARALLWGWHRGLLFYAPIVSLAVPGWAVLAARRWWGVATVSAATVAAVFLVNLSYPEWTGGWSTGPRLLVPMLPFAMLPVAALLGTGRRVVVVGAVLLALAGGAIMLLFQGAGARAPGPILDPIRWFALPIWRGDPNTEARLASNLVSLLVPGALAQLPASWRGVQFLPLVLAQATAIALLYRYLRPPKSEG